jgi:hypothetical protein
MILGRYRERAWLQTSTNLVLMVGLVVAGLLLAN